MINDISGGNLDSNMFKTVSKLDVPYILMHMRGSPKNMMNNTNYDDILSEIKNYFSERISKARLEGVNDIIIDPGL